MALFLKCELNLEKWVTLKKVANTWKNSSHSEKWATLAWKVGSH